MEPPRKDLVLQRFGRLTVIGRAKAGANRGARSICDRGELPACRLSTIHRGKRLGNEIYTEPSGEHKLTVYQRLLS